MRKSAVLQVRQKIVLVCQISVPVVLLLFMGIAQVLVRNEIVRLNKQYVPS